MPANKTFMPGKRHMRKAKAAFKGPRRIKFYGLMASLLANNVSAEKALDTINDIWSDGGNSPKVPEAIMASNCKAALAAGQPLGQALTGWVPSQESSLLTAGERAGNIVQAFRDATRVAENKAKIRAAIIQAVAYPVLLSILLGVLLTVIARVLVPAIEPLVTDDQWVGFAWILKMIAEIVNSFGILVVLFIITLAFMISFSLPRLVRYRTVLDSWPVYSTYKSIQGAIFMLNTSVMVRANIPLTASLEMQRDLAEPWLASRLDAALYGLRIGKDLGEALNNGGHGFPDKTTIKILSVYAKQEGFDESLSSLSESVIQETITNIQTKSKIIFAASIILIALLMAVVVMGTFQINDAVSASTESSTF